MRSEDLGYERSTNGLKGPVGSVLCRQMEAGRDRLRFGASVLRPSRDPLLDAFDFGCGQLLLAGRHLAGTNLFEDQTLCRFTCNEGRAGFAALRNQSLEPQVEAPLELFRVAVALEAISLQDRADVVLECIGRIRAASRPGQSQRQPEESIHRRARTTGRWGGSVSGWLLHCE